MRPRLILLALTALMIFSAILIGPASASPATGAHKNSEQTKGTPKLNRTLAPLVLSPARGSIRADASQTYTAKSYDAGLVKSTRRLVERTRRPVERTRRPVVSTPHQVERSQPLARLMLSPPRAFIPSGGRLTYHAEGYDTAGHPLGDVTAQTTFSIRFSAAKTSRSIRPDGSCTKATCTAIKLGRHTVIGTFDLKDRAISGTAALQVVPERRGSSGHPPPTNPPPTTPPPTTPPPTNPPPTTPPPTTPPPTNPPPTTQTGCAPSATDVRGLKVAPSKAAPGTQVHITAQTDPRLGACPLRVLLDGSRLGGDATIGPDGGISVRRSVPDDAKPGITTVRLATTDGRTLAQASFEIIPKPRPSWLRWLLFAIAALLLLVLVLLAILAERERRRRRWARQHVRAEPHPSSDDVTVDQDPQSAPTFSVRLQPYRDAGTQTLKEGD